MGTELNWVLDHWWLFAIAFLVCSIVFMAAAIYEAPTEEEYLRGDKQKNFWKFIWKHLTCKHDNCEFLENDRIFHCKDCGIKRRA